MQNYEKVKVIGKGSFGAAWLVRRRQDGKRLIAKEVQMAGMKPREKDEARNEVRLLSQLKHPNITQYHESFEHQASLYIVMEYADGGDLAGKIRNRKGKRMTEEDIMNHFVQICLALDYLHRQHILHRDLKCQNVFLTSNGVIKLGDFGIATVLRNTMALAHTVCGTPYYFSPELCQNKPYNNKSDIWALGCILYELSTLQHAFDGHNMKILMQKIVRGTYPPISSEYSKDLRDLIGKMLSREEYRRPAIGQVLQMGYVSGYVCALGKILGQNVTENKSMVPEEEKKQNIVHAKERVQQQEAMMRAKRNDIQEQLKRREEAARREAEEIIARRKKMENENQQNFQEKMEHLRIQQQQRMREAQKRAEVQDRERAEQREAMLKREEEEKEKKRKIREEELEKWRAKRKQEQKEAQAREARQQALNKEREEQWDRQMRAQQEEERAKDEMLQQMRNERDCDRAKQDEQERQKAAGRAYWEMRNAAAENRRKAEEDYERQRKEQAEAARLERERAEPSREDQERGARNHTPTDEERRDAFLEMRREARRNRERFEADLRGHAAHDPHERPSPRDEGPAPSQTPPARRETPPRRNSPIVERIVSPITKQLPDGAVTPPAPAPAPPAEEGVDQKGQEAEQGVDLEHWLNDNAVAGEDGDEQDDFVDDYQGMVKHIEGLRTAAQDPQENFSDPEAIMPQPMDILTAMSKFVLDGKTLNLPNVKAGDPLMYRIEALKMFLSEELGEERFLKVYRRLDGIGPDDSDAVLSDIGHLLGDKLALLQLVTQLIFCEDQFNIQQNKPPEQLPE